MKSSSCVPLAATLALLTVAPPTAEAQQAGPRGQRAQEQRPEVVRPVGQRVPPPWDEEMPRTLAMADNVWIEELTYLEVRDLIRTGSTTALILGGTLEENGPYLTTGKHNHVLKVMGDAIARRLGHTLVAPIVRLDGGNPEEADSPGGIKLSPETYRAVFRDMATSLKAQGFKEIYFLGDSGSNQTAMADVAGQLAEAWRGEDVIVAHIREYYNYSGPNGVVAYQRDVLGIDEDPRLDTYHDDYYISTLIMHDSPEHVRLDQRIKVGLDHINSIPIELDEALEHGRKLIHFRASAAISAIEKVRASRR